MNNYSVRMLIENKYIINENKIFIYIIPLIIYVTFLLTIFSLYAKIIENYGNGVCLTALYK
jgi:hypothetical protein